MRFKRSVQRYGHTPEPATPYQRAGQIWDERIGSARLQARNWRIMAFGGLLLTAGMSSALVWQSLQSHIVPYVVEVDHLGEARSVSPANRDYRPDDPEIAWHLSRFIEQIRSVSLDPVLMRQNWLSAYAFVTKRGARYLDSYARASDPFASIGERTISVQVTSVVRASDQSFQIKWTQTAFERGTQVGVSHWTGIVSVVHHAPASAEILRRNPLGIYIDSIDWSRELDPAVTAPAAATVNGGDTVLPSSSPEIQP
ncbi:MULTISPECIES: conjugal transfer protein TrbF [Stakelama]|uniref:Conjugal transfer protein TrbF n=3 Tax=Stakelama TaxID=1124625 RepID=A0A8T4IKQ3_9SPHN|nr:MULTISPECIES: conjugal transfer protein TrbF [Stakelama]MAW99932.1 conjugal transfer protein TrbF [Sphingomonas sp.]MBR0552756.1 conjugal transfer protein TrbF [Stakelama marina]TDN85312.1 type IV secretion system protein VirB5 [Stakelama pacifica]WNO53490.1 conjugal transfer protein TrbF [Stakelama sp. W311]GGO93008.1 conjugal transfer protein TrbF [Stakelama pacifica]|tara:strand:- start:227 stop:991 length:765 start_codon:yes stop_codon:yes gene_type:complete